MSKYVNIFIDSESADYTNDTQSQLKVNFNPAIKLSQNDEMRWYAKCLIASIPYVSPNIYENHYNTFIFKYNGSSYTFGLQYGLYSIENLQTKIT